MIFDVSFMHGDTERRERHGQPWTEKDSNILALLANSGADLGNMCRHLRRPANGIVPKLVQIGFMQEAYQITKDSSLFQRHLARAKAAVNATTVPDWWTPDTNVVSALDTTTHYQTLPKDWYISNSSITPTTQESAMTIETKTFINGREASSMSDAEIFTLISKLEKQVDNLKSIRAASKKVAAQIKEIEDDIAKLVAYVDER